MQYQIQYNTVKPNFKVSAVLLQFRESFGLKKGKDKEKKNSRLDIYISVHPKDLVETFSV